MAMPYFVTTFYFFKSINAWTRLPKIKRDLEHQGKELGILGLFILGPEGLNGTCSASTQAEVDQFKSWLRDYFEVPELLFKDSRSHVQPFAKFKVKVRKEICTLGAPGVSGSSAKNHHLSAKEWQSVLESKEPYVLVDTRNAYEYRIGTFKGALNPKIDQFSDFPSFVEQQGYSKNQKILIFCTGGIRCEKAIVDLQNKGFDEVYQLEGGILKYLEEYPNSKFEGECFVFDNRVAVDQELKPTEVYKLCPHCGQPGKLHFNCIRCDSPAIICGECAVKAVVGETCSKNCAHHYGLNPSKKGRRQARRWECQTEA